MEDLLNEDDFSLKRNSYNPWKLFKVFYGIAILQIIVMQLVVSYWITDFNGFFMGVIYLLLPVLMAVFMFTYNTKSFFVDRKVKLAGILGLVVCYVLTNVTINLVKVVYIRKWFIQKDIIMQLLSGIGYCIIQFLVSAFVIFLVTALVKRKVRSQTTLQSPSL